MQRPKLLWLEPKTIHNKIGNYLELFEDVIILAVIVLIFMLSAVAIYQMAEEILLNKIQIQEMAQRFIYIFILSELFRLTIIYLKERRIDIDTIVNTTIIALLREVVIKTSELSMQDFIGISIFLIAITFLFKSEAYKNKFPTAHS